MGNFIGRAAVIDFGVQWAAWVLAAALKTEKFYDLTGALTNIALIILSLRATGTYSTRQLVNSGMVLAWAGRLGIFLFSRVVKDGGDRRFDVVKHKPGVFWIYWTIQGVWILSTLLPTLIVNSKEKDKKINAFDYIGWSLWGAGFLLEVVADHQKSKFRSLPENHGKFVSTGLWSVSRHPNYLGEILMWIGLYVSALPVLKGWENVGVVSPLLIIYLLTRVSGIPLLEKSGLKRWGSNPVYQAYLKNTAALIPYIW